MAWWEPLLNFGCMEERDGIPSTPICTHFTMFVISQYESLLVGWRTFPLLPKFWMHEGTGAPSWRSQLLRYAHRSFYFDRNISKVDPPWTSSCQWLRFSFKMSILTLYNLLWGNLGHCCYWFVKYFYSCCTLYVLTLYNLLWGNLGHFKCMFRCRYLLWNYQIRLLIVQCNGQVWDKAKVQWSLKTKILNHAIFENLNLGTLLFHEYGKGFE